MARKYYYDDGENKVGPVSGEDLLRLRASGSLSDDTWVRSEKSATWRPLASVDLREEEAEARNPSFWKILRRHMPLRSIILLVAVLVVFVVAGIAFVGVFWPVLLVLFFFWLFLSMMRR